MNPFNALFDRPCAALRRARVFSAFDVSDASVLIAPLLLLAACHPGGAGTHVPGDPDDPRAYGGIAAQDELHFSGTEPFWGGSVKGATLTYTTPEDAAGTALAVERFAGRGGVSFSGQLGTQRFDMMVTQGSCSDGMSDRTYPFVVTLRIGDEQRGGCGWSDARPFTGPAHP